MSNQSECSKGEILRLKHRLDVFVDLLDVGGKFTVRSDHIDPDAIRSLQQCNALRRVGEKTVDNGSHYVGIFRWDEDIRQELQDYRDRRDELPCGHKSHIYNPRDRGGYTCKFCPDDDKPIYTKSTVKACLK